MEAPPPLDRPSNLITGCSGRFFLFFAISISWLASYCVRACEPFDCGFYSLNYPFGKKNSGCGDPALQLECDNRRGIPLLNVSGHQYYLMAPKTYLWQPFLKGDFTLNMTIMDKNMVGNVCNPSSSNNTVQFWSSHQFHIANKYQNVSLWGQCDEGAVELSNLSWTKVGCSSDGWYYIRTSNLSLIRKLCKSLVQLPVRNSDVIGLQSNLQAILQKEFEINWSFSKGCEECLSRNGFCIYDPNNLKQLSCNGTVYGIVAAKSKPKTAIVLVCSVGGVALASAVVLLIIFYMRRRNLLPIRGVASHFCNCPRNDREAGRPEYTAGNLPIFSYQELQLATNNFDEKNGLGDGGSGAVYMGKLKDERVVAVKRLYQENSRRVEQFINEVEILSSLNHPNLVRLYGCTCPKGPDLLLVYEFVPNGTLADHLHGSRRTPKGLPWGTRLKIAIETAQALTFLHSVDPPIFHRDVKSTNILIDENFRAKVADFGLSRLMPVNLSHVTTAPQGTPGYVDPEYHQRFQLTEKSDVYSFGVVLVELISAKVAVDITRDTDEISLAYMAIDKIRRGALDELVDPDLKIQNNQDAKMMVGAVAELAFRCLATDRDVRPDMKEVAASLEEIKDWSPQQQISYSEESAILLTVTPTVSPTSVHEKWPSIPSVHEKWPDHSA